jgi:hypothetical protein
LRPQHLVEQSGDPRVIVRAWAAGPLLAVKPRLAMQLIALPPMRDGRDRHIEATGDGRIAQPIGRQQNHLGASDHAVRHRSRPGYLLQRLSFG